MTVELVYVYPATLPDQYRHYAARFVASYISNPTPLPHRTVVVVNGDRLDSETESLFLPLPNLTFLPHNNAGYDIGAFQAAARVSQADLQVYCGATAYIRNPAWLDRAIASFQKWGQGVYGTMGNRGMKFNGTEVFPHIRTTGFWTTPALMNRYPHRVTRADQRYPFEHGRDCFTEWVKRLGLRPLVVTPFGEYEWAQWDTIPNGFHRGNQGSVLIGDKLSEPPFYPYP